MYMVAKEKYMLLKVRDFAAKTLASSDIVAEKFLVSL